MGVEGREEWGRQRRQKRAERYQMREERKEKEGDKVSQ